MSDLSILHYDENKDIEVEVDVKIGYYQPPVKGVYSGPPEDCYPDEPAEVEYSIKPVEYSYLEEDSVFMDKVLEAISEMNEEPDCEYYD